MNKYELRQWPLTLAVGSGLAAGSLQAATITVNSQIDAPVGTFPYTCTLRAALQAASSQEAVDFCPAGDYSNEIQFDPGLASSTITLESPLRITSHVTISGPVADDASGIRISGNNVDGVFEISGFGRGSPIDVTLEDLTIERGLLDDPDAKGGGIESLFSNLTLRDASVVDNYSNYGGGGIRVQDGELTLERTLVSGNGTGSFGSGGGVIAENATLTVTDSEISLNTGYYGGGGLELTDSYALIMTTDVTGNTVNGYFGGPGGGINVAGASTVSIVDSSISGNTILYSGSGGGISSSASILNLTDSVVSNNSLGSYDQGAQNGAGIAVFGMSLSLDRTEVSGNQTGSALANGAGIWGRNVSAEISDSVISGNVLEIGTGFGLGGGLYFSESTGSIVYSEISENRVSGDSASAGGIALAGSVFSIRNSTISSNALDTSDVGNGSATSGLVMIGGPGYSVEMVHSTIAGNVNLGSIPALSVRKSGAMVWNLNNSLITAPVGSALCNTAADTASFSLAADISCTGTATDSADIALGPLANNGGFNRTHALEPGSVAIDLSGNCFDAFAIAFDQRRVSRDAQCDAGSFELRPDALFNDRFESPP